MNLEQYKILKIQADKDLEITPDNAYDKNLKFAGIYNRYLDLLIHEMRIFRKLEADRDKYYGELYHKLKFPKAGGYKKDGVDFSYKLDNKGEIDIYIRNDERYYNMLLECQQQDLVVKYLESILTNINNSRYAIKNHIEQVKLKMGIQ